jgi:tetratricopeptide (TPR) repeat protein
MLSDPDDLRTLPIGGDRLREDLRRISGRLGHEIVRTTPGADLLRMRQTHAVALCALGDSDADDEATRAVYLGKFAAQPHLVRARIRRWMGERARALEDVDDALALEPQNPQAWELRSILRTESGDAAGGLADIDQALEYSDDRSLRGPRARALVALGRFDEAVTEWGLDLVRDPENPDSFLGRAEAFTRLGKWDQALGDLEQAISWAEGRPDLGPRIALAYGRCLVHRPGRWSRLIDLFRRTLDDWSRLASRGS